MQGLMLVIAFGLMNFVLLLYWFLGRGGSSAAAAGSVSEQRTDPGSMTPLIDQIALSLDAAETAGMTAADAAEPPRTDRLSEIGPKLRRPLRKALPIANQPLIVIGFRPGEDAIEITLPSEDMAEARRLSLTPDISPDPRGGCIVRLGGVTVARVHSAMIGQRDVILREEVAA